MQNKPQPPTDTQIHSNRKFVLFTIQLGNIGILFIGISNQLRKTISLQHQNTLGFFIRVSTHFLIQKHTHKHTHDSLGSYNNCVNREELGTGGERVKQSRWSKSEKKFGQGIQYTVK